MGPFFEHRKQIEKLAGDSQMLSAYHFFLKYKDDEIFIKGINSVLEFYKEKYKNHHDILWKVMLSAQTTISENENKMSSLKGQKIDLVDNDLYEYVIQLFKVIETILELSVKTILQEMYALMSLEKQGSISYNEILKPNFGYVIDTMLKNGLFNSILLVEPNNLRLSDWRNIAAHGSFYVNKNFQKLALDFNIT